MSIKLAVRITDLGEAVHGGEVIVQTHVIEIQNAELERLIKPFLKKKPPGYQSYSISVVYESEEDESSSRYVNPHRAIGPKAKSYTVGKKAEKDAPTTYVVGRSGVIPVPLKPPLRRGKKDAEGNQDTDLSYYIGRNACVPGPANVQYVEWNPCIPCPAKFHYVGKEPVEERKDENPGD